MKLGRRLLSRLVPVPMSQVWLDSDVLHVASWWQWRGHVWAWREDTHLMTGV